MIDRMLIVSCLLPFILLGGCTQRGSQRMATWTMLPVNEAIQQADAHLIQTRTGSTLLIDAGFTDGAILPLLQKYGIKKIDLILISHPHKDHYGGLWTLLGGVIPIGKVVMNFPLRQVCDPEKGWGCDFEDLEKLKVRAREKGTEILASKAGDILFKEEQISLQTLVAYDGLNTPVGQTDINDTSIIAMLKVGATKVLFTGDLNDRMGSYLAHHSSLLNADILKVPHHGTEGVAPDLFFERVSPLLAMVPSPAHLWKSERSSRIRKFFKNAGIPTLVSGREGSVVVEFFATTWTAKGERARR